MDSLPSHILDEILLKLDDPKSLAMMQCANRAIRWHISNDLYFKSKYMSLRFASELFHVSTFGSNIIFWHSCSESWSTRNSDDPLEDTPRCKILASCSGLLLLFTSGLCVTNPLKKKSFRFLDHSESKLLPDIIRDWKRSCKVVANHIGFAADRITQSFKIVCLSEQRKASNPEETTYRFEISAGECCWKLSDSTITCSSSNLMPYMKPVYLDHGDVHWLRYDGSVIAFNPETEKARLITIKSVPTKQSSSKIMFTGTDQKELTLITATEDVTCVYALESILNDPKWVLVKRIVNREMMMNWNIAGYDSECLVVKEKKTTNKERYNGSVFHVYNLKVDTKFYCLDSLNVIMKLICGLSEGNVKSLCIVDRGRRKTEEKRLIREEGKRMFKRRRGLANFG